MVQVDSRPLHTEINKNSPKNTTNISLTDVIKVSVYIILLPISLYLSAVGVALTFFAIVVPLVNMGDQLPVLLGVILLIILMLIFVSVPFTILFLSFFIPFALVFSGLGQKTNGIFKKISDLGSPIYFYVFVWWGLERMGFVGYERSGEQDVLRVNFIMVSLFYILFVIVARYLIKILALKYSRGNIKFETVRGVIILNFIISSLYTVTAILFISLTQ